MKRIYKRILNILAVTLLAASLFSCSLVGGKDKGEDEPGEKIEFTEGDFKMIATVTDLGEKIAVDVIEAEYASGIHWVIISDQTAIVTEDGYKLSRDDIKVGDKVEITYNGQVMMSLPPQIVAISIRKI